MKRITTLAALLTTALALGACDDIGTGTGEGGAPRLSILLTDAPGDFRAAVVTITDVYLQPAEGEGAERVYLRRGAPVTTNLLRLSNDVLELAQEREVPAGTYQQLRFVVTGGYIEVENADGSTTIYASSPDYAGLPAGARVGGELHMPSFAQSGIKVRLPNGAGSDDGSYTVTGDKQALLVDFDVSRSFGRAAGKSGKWVMSPSLKATSVQAAGSATVTLALNDTTVKLPTLNGSALTLGAFSATLAPAAGGDAKTVRLTDENQDGVFEARFRYLFPGSYSVGLAAPSGVTFKTDRTLPVAVTVNPGGDTRTELKLTAAGLQP